MKPFKVAYKVVRHNSNEIYKGFGFHHLSDATQYYVHPDNQSFKGTTTLCQPIGEAIILFAMMLKSCIGGDSFGDYYVSEDRKTVWIEINISQEYRLQGIVDEDMYKCRVVSENEEVTIAAYDIRGNWIDGNMEHLRPLYKLLPTFCVLLAREMEEQSDYHNVMDGFIENPVVDKILSVYHKIKKKIETEELDVVIFPRNLENWARLAKYEGYMNAAEKTIIPIAKCDRILENTFRGIIILYKWN